MKSVDTSYPYFMVQYLAIFLANLDTLKRAPSKNGTTSHFEGAYTKPGSAWELTGCKREKGKTARLHQVLHPKEE
jgi:hypothetical protein